MNIYSICILAPHPKCSDEKAALQVFRLAASTPVNGMHNILLFSFYPSKKNQQK